MSDVVRVLGVALVLTAVVACAPAVRRPGPDEPTAAPSDPTGSDAGAAGPSGQADEPMPDPFVEAIDLAPVDDDDGGEPESEPLTPAASEELAEEPPEVPPERAAEERELASEAVTTFDVPVEVNDQVLRWLDYYSVRRKDSFVQGLIRSGRYVSMFREIFASHGVPQDLVYMAHVESAYKTSAYSRAHAKGIYQFISATGRRYGLRIDWYVDERSDPEKAAHASASYLRDLHDEFGDWYLALAAYNAGEGRVRRAIARSGSRDFWEHSRRRFYRRETRNYVPAILAAILISKEPSKYGFEFEPAPAIEYDTIHVDGAADLRVLAECAGTDVDALRELNPALRRMQTPPDGTTDVRVPAGSGERAMAALAEVPADQRVLYTFHRIRRGDTLGAIARRYGVSVSSIQQANGMGRRTMIREGRVLRVPSSSARIDAGGIVPDVAAIASGEPVVHAVRRGDSLWAISRRYGTTPAAIARANGISVNEVLRVGQRLTVSPGGGSVPASVHTGAATTSYVVRRGDTLSGIAQRHGTSATAIARASGISVRSTLRPGDRLSVPDGAGGEAISTRTYVVRRGDTLSAIAARHGTSPAAIARASDISVRSTLHPGDRLRVPSNGTVVARAGSGAVDYTVRRGDSLWRIANRHRTSVDAICRANGISRNATLRPGTRLTIPMP